MTAWECRYTTPAGWGPANPGSPFAVLCLPLMTRIDQFESAFKAAARTVYAYERVEMPRVLVVTDLDADGAGRYRDRVASFLAVLASGGQGVEWRAAERERSATVGDLLAMVEAESPDLVVTYRNLHTQAWRWPHSLGDRLEVLTQATPVPVLVLPRPETDWRADDTDQVLALTDHISGDARPVNNAVRLTRRDGELCLAHVEDEGVFERYLEVIGKIPEIDTDTAREKIREQLLKEAADYIVSVKEVLRAEERPISLSKVVEMGHRLDYMKRLIDERSCDLLVLNTKDEDQLAMHGLAYPLAVELTGTPILML